MGTLRGVFFLTGGVGWGGGDRDGDGDEETVFFRNFEKKKNKRKKNNQQNLGFASAFPSFLLSSFLLD